MLIDNFKLVDGGRFREDAMRALLAAGPYPARNPEQNIADLKAQVAANEKGVRGAARDDRALRARRRAAPTCATYRTTPRKACAA